MITRMKDRQLDRFGKFIVCPPGNKGSDTDAMDVRVKTNRNSILSSKTLFLSPSTGQTPT